MSIESGLTTELSSITGLNGKVYPLTAPEKTIAPYAIYVSSEGSAVKDLDGFDKLKEVPIELNIVGARYSDMKSLTGAVIVKLQSFEGRTVGGVYVQEVTYQTPVEIYESQVGLYRCVIDTRFYFEG